MKIVAELFESIKKNDSARVKQIITENPKLIHQKTKGCCALELLFVAVVTEAPSRDMIKLLLDAGLDPNSCNECVDISALGEAAKRGHTSIVQLLIEHKADVNKQCAEGSRETPLMLAAEHDHADVVKLLLRNGADPSIVDVNNETALMKTMKKGHESVALLIKEAMDKK